MIHRQPWIVLPLALIVLFSDAAPAAEPAPAPAPGYFAIEVVDDQTGRGVPMVELQTTAAVRYYTDSSGLVAFDEPGLMGQKVWFSVASHGYEYPADGFGQRGASLEVRPGGSAKLKIHRINIAQRLYRTTGQGIYRDTVLLGRKPPIAEPLLNAQITGQDSVMTALYRGRLYWFYGDTSRLSYPLGNFAMTGATTDTPDKIDPEAGVNLQYFTGDDGFAKRMVPIEGEGVVWLSGLAVLPDENGQQRMLGFFQRRRGLGAVLENGFVVYNDDKECFEKLKAVANDPPLFPTGQPLTVKEPDGEYLYFTAPYPALRVKAQWGSYLDLAQYEGYTPLKAGTRYEGKVRTQLDRDAEGRVVWSWKKNTPPLKPQEERDLAAAGALQRDRSPHRLHDAAGKPILLNNCSCAWNAYRKCYIMIASEVLGATVLGETWYSESDRPEGPWGEARKIITHANKPGDAHDFYNPAHHPFFNHSGGQIIYFEGTYVNTFSGNPHPTPRYEYNQMVYSLDLADPRLRLPGRP